MRYPILVTLLACSAPEPASLPSATAPPPMGAELATSYLVAGVQNQITLSGVPVGARTGLFASRATTGPDACPAVLAGRCLDLPAPAVFVTSSGPAATSTVTLSFTPPANAPAGPVALQATTNGGAFSPQTEVLHVAMFTAAGDEDGDGLTNATEAQVGSDPLTADTDGDGLTDGDEVLVLGTDPTLRDTDGGGRTDDEELDLGLDPLDPADDCEIPDDPALSVGESPAFAGVTTMINDERDLVGSPRVGWSDALEASAELHARDMAATCSPSFTQTGNGQTIAAGSTLNVPNLVSQWFTFQDEHDPDDVFPTCSRAAPGSTPGSCGHYTQVVWDTTTSVGCAVASNTTCGGLRHYVACHWSPPGNFTGRKAYPIQANACLDQDHDGRTQAIDSDDRNASVP